MKQRPVFSSLLLMALLVAVSSTAVASTTWYVDGVNGNDHNSCKSRQHACKTIGHAISLASSGDSIMVAPATYTENLTIGLSLKVIGSGAASTIIDGGGVNRVVAISNTNAHITLSNLTIQDGKSGTQGGGILNSGTLTISKSTVSGNSAKSGGGGIYNSGTLTVNKSTISGNSAKAGGGGILNQNGTVVINNSTLRGNSAKSGGGGIFSSSVFALTINNSTLGGNSTSFRGGGIYNISPMTISNSTLSGNSARQPGGGIENLNAAAIQNSIVANSPSGGNCHGGVSSNGYNLSSDNTCNFNSTGDLNNTDPKLGALKNNGGPTQTEALLPGSPAIDSGNPTGCTDGNGHLLKTDQRGYPRPDKEDTGGCDMGAFERQKD